MLGGNVVVAKGVKVTTSATYLAEIWGGKLDVYGEFDNTADNYGALTVKATSEINIYDGAIVRSEGSPVQFKCEGNGRAEDQPFDEETCKATVNVYGGDLESYGGYTCVWNSKATDKSTINVFDGTFTATPGIFRRSGALTITALTDDCTAKFSTAEGGWSGDTLYLKDVCAEGYEPLLGADGYYMIGVPVAKIGDKKFGSLAAAFDAAKAGDKVEMLSNVELDSALVINEKNVTFDLGAFDLTLAANNLIVSNSTLVVTNGEIATTSNGGVIYFRAGSAVTLAQEAGIYSLGTYRFEVEDATFNVYGSVTNTADEVPAIHCLVAGGVINVYEGALIKAAGDAIRANGKDNPVTINVYGGRLESTGNYPVFYSYKSGNTTIFNIYGGELKSSNSIFANNKDNPGPFVVTPLDDTCTAKFSTIDKGWDTLTLNERCAPGYAPVKEGDWYVIKPTYTVTLKNGDEVVDTQVVADGQFATNVVLAVEGFKGWTNETYTAAFEFEKTEIKADITLFAWIEAPAPLFPVDDDSKVTPEGKENEATAIEVFGDGLAEYIATVYGEGGKIPYEKINGTSADLIKIAKEYELPIMTEPEVEIEKAAEGDGFTFQIVDDGTPVAMQAEKVLSMVQFTADLGVAFDAATTDNVEVALSTDKKTATATFTKATNAGFMKVKLAVPTTAE